MDKSAIRYPFSPDPSGWFSIGAADAIVPGEITTVSYFSPDDAAPGWTPDLPAFARRASHAEYQAAHPAPAP
jgi:hypothetical protein